MKNDDIAVQAGRHLTLKQQAFYKSEEAIQARNQLKLMVSNPKYNTQASNNIGDLPPTSFVDKHLSYLSRHPNLNTQHYLSNLRLKTKING